jgi:hypothetical protein
MVSHYNLVLMGVSRSVVSSGTLTCNEAKDHPAKCCQANCRERH